MGDSQRVEPEPSPGTFDPDLDVPRRRSSRRSDESLEPYQRLVANPFLAVLCWLVAFGFFRTALRRHSLIVFLAGLGLSFVAVLLFQFHCLDCGATGWLLGHRRHACSPVVARWQSRALRRFRGPRVKTQIVAWFVLVASAFVLGVAFGSRQ
jgi:hypothetical protein